MESIIVALWTLPTSSNPMHCNETVELKFAAMERALKKCQAMIAEKADKLSKTSPFQAIFAAPEYYFTERGSIRRPMAEATKVGLEHKILTQSRSFPKTLIVPGTIYYWKTLLRKAFSPKLNRDSGDVFATTTDKNRRHKVLSKLTDAMLRELELEAKFSGLVSDQGLAAHPIRFQKGPTGLPLPSMFTKFESLMEKTSCVVRNETYLYLNGIRHAKYDKQTDAFESLSSPDDMVFVPGTRDECPVIGRHRFGVEICLDHSVGRLKRRNVAGLHFHIVTSDATDNEVEYMAMGNQGYFLHASSDPNQTHVYHKDKAGSINVLLGDEYLGDVESDAGRLHFWLLPLPPVSLDFVSALSRDGNSPAQ
jgi:hypothetical protein